MKLHGITVVLVPWFDTDGNKNWFTFRFSGTVDRRRVFREIRKHVKNQLGRKVSKRWMHENCAIVNDPMEGRVEPTQAEIDAFIQRMEYNENEDQPNPDGSGGSAQEAGR